MVDWRPAEAWKMSGKEGREPEPAGRERLLSFISPASSRLATSMVGTVLAPPVSVQVWLWCEARPLEGLPGYPLSRDRGWCCCCLRLTTPGEAARQLWSKLCDHFWVLKAARRPVNESCWKLAVSGVEQVVEQLVGCVALLGLLEPVELQLSLPCRQACSDRIIIINTSHLLPVH